MGTKSAGFGPETAWGIHWFARLKTVENQGQLLTSNSQQFSPGCEWWGNRANLPIALFSFHNAPASKAGS